MHLRWPLKYLLAISFMAVSHAAVASPITINFDNLSDSEYVTTQYAGVSFTNAIILSAGISLNEFDFPPESGTNVAADINGPISILFASPISMFYGYFTYAESLTIQGYNSASVLEASAVSLFSANYVSGGDIRSSPDELIQISSATPFTRVVLTGDPSGSSFTVDDVTYNPANGGPLSPTPEPSALVLVLTGIASMIGLAGMKGAKPQSPATHELTT